MNLFVNTELPATSSLIRGLENNSSISIEEMFAGDIVPMHITFTNGTGSYANFSGLSSIKIRAGVGLVATRQTFSTFDATYHDHVYSGNMDLGTAEILNYIDQQNEVQLYLELQLSEYGGYSETLLQMPFTLRQQIIL